MENYIMTCFFQNECLQTCLLYKKKIFKKINEIHLVYKKKNIINATYSLHQNIKNRETVKI